MNVFELRDSLIADYSSYIESFIRIRDERIRREVESELEGGLLWPDPLIQLNPAFEPGAEIEQLVDEGVLRPECRKVFRIKKTETDEGRPLRLHRHQEKALRTAKTGRSYVLTTGTGSGKSLSYIVPIVDHVLRRGSGKGIQAIVVYPMNALANSQLGELKKFLGLGYPEGQPPVTFARYTGQDDYDRREEITQNPPDILLTNYVMLELIMTRPYEDRLIRAAQGLRFLVFDELHTYRGRQGADVAMLIRRVRDLVGGGDLQCVGTSATMAGSGTWSEQQAQVAEVAGKLFGSTLVAESVIGETLQRSTRASDFEADAEARKALRARVLAGGGAPDGGFEAFRQDPLAAWIETAFGLETEVGSGRLIRTEPRSLRGESSPLHQLATLTGASLETCGAAVRATLLAGYRCAHPETGFPAFAFRLHQFISRGKTVHSSIEAADERHVTVFAQQYVPGDRNKVLLPLVFCRECGQEYYCVRMGHDASGQRTFEPRDLTDQLSDEESEAGFFYLSAENPWPSDPMEELDRLPDEWLEVHRGRERVRRVRRDALPRAIRVDSSGIETKDGLDGHFVPAPFRFCLKCGVAYYWRTRSDFGKLTSLATEGRSTATTVLVLSMMRRLRSEESLEQKARKLLSFTDNRQDASLQAGHFNDFVEISILRGALYGALREAGQKGLEHDELSQKVFAQLALPLELYASDPEIKFAGLKDTDRAFREVIGYRLYRDLQRGWRITSPNLEQCGLVKVDYRSLDEVCAAAEIWQGSHEALLTARPETREDLAGTLLDFMRRELALKVDYLDPEYQEKLSLRSHQRLREPWAIDEGEDMEKAVHLFPRQRDRRADGKRDVFLGPRSGFNQYLRRSSIFPDYGSTLTTGDALVITQQLLHALRQAGIVEAVEEPRDQDDPPGYQLNAASMVWRLGDGERAFRDPIRVPRAPEGGSPPNRFFVEFYGGPALGARGLEAREHTAQVPMEEREKREKRFHDANLPVLFCSPTMELGVDIAQLNVVNLRNVPPTPANYAQRSGRAGRSGQPALVFTYCSSGSPHDQYFFQRPQRMVAGAVAPPRLEVANEDLVRAHLHAIWLRETGKSLGDTLRDVIDVAGTPPALELLPDVAAALDDRPARQRARERAQRVLATVSEDLEAADWYQPSWVDTVYQQLRQSFLQACARWKSLYLSAYNQIEAQHAIRLDQSRPKHERETARTLRRQAETQIALLTEPERAFQSDFGSYRYFASEGFLPGYNFPRLPLSAFIPGRRRKKGEEEFLSRPRFLAISEFGPRSIVYHEGSKYLINRVILPVQEEDTLTNAARFCERCGYLHPISGSVGADVCDLCGATLGATMPQLFRLQNVSTRRRDRISSDEEERLRLGFELVTRFRFAPRGGTPSARRARVLEGEEEFAELTYADTATLWRINRGWKRRTHREELGFVLDLERGLWGSNKQMADEDPEDPMSARLTRVVPYVEDHRNSLLWRPSEKMSIEQLVSLRAVLKHAIQVVYQLEDSELAAEPLPDAEDPSLLLFYEAAEGGAGALRQLLDDPGAVAAVARAALDLCHFDPDTGEDRGRAPGARERCEAACYDCLMSYTNQPDHRRLDRLLLRDQLLRLAGARVEAAPVEKSRGEHLEHLLTQAGSELERRWLRFLEERQLHLPAACQAMVEACQTRPDFLYTGEHQVAIYVDGPPHDHDHRHQRDRQQTECMEDLGYIVLRFHHQDDWQEIVDRFPYVFGSGGS